MTLHELVKRGMQKIVSNVRPAIAASMSKNLLPISNAFTEHEQSILDLMAHETSMLTKLNDVKKELSFIGAYARNRQILLGTDFGMKKSVTYLKLDEGIEVKEDEIETLTRNFNCLSKEEGTLPAILDVTNETIKKRITEGSSKGICSSKFKLEVKRVSHERTIAYFQRMQEATQYFELFDYLHEKRDLPNCSSEEILKMYDKELQVKFPHLNKRVLKLGIDEYILRLQDLHEAELFYRFCLFLPTYEELITGSPDAKIEWIKHSEEFQKKFNELPDYIIEEGLDIHRQHMENKYDKDEDKWTCAYEEDVKWHFEHKRKSVLEVRNPMSDVVYKTVFKMQNLGYQMNMNGDPETEVWNMLKRLKDFEREEKSRTLHNIDEIDLILFHDEGSMYRHDWSATPVVYETED